MTSEFWNHVTLYGPAEDIIVATSVIQALWEKVKVDETRPEMVKSWRVGTDFEVIRLDPFQATPRFWPSNYLPKLSDECPNVVFEWSYFGDADDFYCLVFKNGQALVNYLTLVDRDDEDDLTDEYYYLEAKRFEGLTAS